MDAVPRHRAAHQAAEPTEGDERGWRTVPSDLGGNPQLQIPIHSQDTSVPCPSTALATKTGRATEPARDEVKELP